MTEEVEFHGASVRIPPPFSHSTTNLQAAHGSRAQIGLTSWTLLSLLVVLAGELVAKYRVKRSNLVSREALPASSTSRSAREGGKWERMRRKSSRWMVAYAKSNCMGGDLAASSARGGGRNEWWRGCCAALTGKCGSTL